MHYGILERSGFCAHVLEFHRSGERRIGQSAGRFLAEALKEEGVALAVAGPRCVSGIVAEIARLGHDPVVLMQLSRLQIWDSSEMLSRFMRQGRIDRDEFQRTVAASVRAARARAGGAQMRAYGEMAGELWQRGERAQAIELEQLWNDLQQKLQFAVLCSYPIDVFSADFCEEEVTGVLQQHTHLSPSGSSAELGRVLDRALDDVLGESAAGVRLRIGKPSGEMMPSMPKAEQTMLWLRKHLPQVADPILERARELYDGGSRRVYLRQQHSRV